MIYDDCFEHVEDRFKVIGWDPVRTNNVSLRVATEDYIATTKSLLQTGEHDDGLWRRLCDRFTKLRTCSISARKELMNHTMYYIRNNCNLKASENEQNYDIIEALTCSVREHNTPKYHGCMNFTPDLGVFYTVPFDFPESTKSDKNSKTSGGYTSIYKPVLHNPRKGVAHEIDEDKASEIQARFVHNAPGVNDIIAQHSERIEGVHTYISEEQSGQMVEEYLTLITNGGISCRDCRTDLLRVIATRHISYFKYNNEIENYLVACWVIGTYLFPMFTVYPYLLFIGEKGTNKSGALTFLSKTCWNPTTKLSLPNETHMFRLCTQAQPTIIIDELHRQLNDPVRGPTLKALLEAGHEKGGCVPRCSDTDSDKIIFHDIYSLKALASRESLELEEKAITIIPKKVMDSKYAIARKDLDTDPTLPALQKEILRYALTNWEAIYDEYQVMKPTQRLAGRYFLLWAPILSICKIACPERYDELTKYAENAVCSIQDSSFEIEIQLLNWLAVKKSDIMKTGNSVLLKDMSRGIQEVPWQSIAHALRNLGLIKNQRNTSKGNKYYLRMDRLDTLITERSITVETEQAILTEAHGDEKGGGNTGAEPPKEVFTCVCGKNFKKRDAQITHSANCDAFQQEEALEARKEQKKREERELLAVKEAKEREVIEERTDEKGEKRALEEEPGNVTLTEDKQTCERIRTKYRKTLTRKKDTGTCEFCKKDTSFYYVRGIHRNASCARCWERYFEKDEGGAHR